MLIKRQLEILKDLATANNPITANILSKKHGVSQRTIRYDLDNIDYYIKRHNLEIIKTPRVGMVIDDKDKALSLLNKLENEKDENCLYTAEDRNNLILINIMLSTTDITSDQLAEKLKVSRSTILSDIKDINNVIKNNQLSIKGKTYHGYTIQGNEENIRNYFSDDIVKYIIKNYKNDVWKLLGTFFEKDEILFVEEIFKEVRKRFSIKGSKDEDKALKMAIVFFIRRLKNGRNISYSNQEVSNHRTTMAFINCENIYYKIITTLGLEYNLNEVVYLNKMVILRSNDSKLLSTYCDEEKLEEVVHRMVAVSYENLNIKEEVVEMLIKELTSHLRSTINRCKLNIKVENSILQQIKVNYGDVFQVAKKACEIFEEEYDTNLSDDEIGFVTMYFCKSLEISKVRVKKNVLIVCNSSRGTSKLLAARIRNNIPEVNIKSIVSVHELQDGYEGLKDIDLIISTVNLENVNKAYIVVNPIITMYNLAQIREILYLDNISNNYEIVIDDFEMSLYNVINKYKDNSTKELYDEVLRLTNQRCNNNLSNTVSTGNKEYFESVALILVDICEMLINLYKGKINEDAFRRICGVFLHIFMAIPRWNAGEFNKEKDIDIFKQKYPIEFNIIAKAFDNISKQHNVKIEKAEIIAIMRYLI